MKSLENEGTDRNFDQLKCNNVHYRASHPYQVPSLLALSCSTLQARSVLHFSIAISRSFPALCASMAIDALSYPPRYAGSLRQRHVRLWCFALHFVLIHYRLFFEQYLQKISAQFLKLTFSAGPKLVFISNDFHHQNE